MLNTNGTTCRILSANCNIHSDVANIFRLDAISTMNESLAIKNYRIFDVCNVLSKYFILNSNYLCRNDA